jgi:hypothetical protein
MIRLGVPEISRDPDRGELRPARPFLSPTARKVILTAHIMMSVGLLGDSAGFLAVAVRAGTAQDTRALTELAGVLNMLSLVFGIPLSFGAILTGLTLGLGTRWGIFRYPWVTAKLVLIISVMVVGGVFIGPAEARLRDGVIEASSQLMFAAAYDVLALSLATVLSVFKPGKPFRQENSFAGEVS